LLFPSGQPAVAVVRADDKVAIQSVTVIRDLGTKLQVSADISESDQLIRNPSPNLSSGAVVTVVKPTQRGVALKLRQKLNSHMLPNAYDDLSLRYQRSWKEHRRTPVKERGQHQPAIPQPSILGLVKPGAAYRDRPTAYAKIS
jgi:hypothetical protein